MIKRFNYTGRKKISRSRMIVSLSQTEEGRLSFDASLHLNGLEFPATAKIFVEAYRRDYFRRFPSGTIANPRFPKNCILEGLDPDTLVMFRIKIVDRKGRILAAADRIKSMQTEGEPAGRVPLLPIDFVDLGQSVWRLDLTGDWPSLLLNKRIENIREIARSDVSFLTLVYPEILRQILCKIVVEEDITDPESDVDDWMGQWLTLAVGLFEKVQLPPSGESEPVVQEKLRWIDDAVEGFCSKNQVMEKFLQVRKSGDN